LGQPARGRFISVEGGEGVGKSALIARLCERLRAAGRTVVATREPGGTPGADKIRALFADPVPGDPWDVATETLLVSASRAQHVARLILPTLTRGAWVVTDRYHDSMRAYQGGLLGVERAWLEQLIAGSTRGLDPDLTLLLDVDVKTAQSRIQRSSAESVRADAITRYDDQSAEKHETLRSAFLELAKRWPDRIAVIDASKSPDEVLARVMDVVAERLGHG